MQYKRWGFFYAQVLTLLVSLFGGSFGLVLPVTSIVIVGQTMANIAKYICLSSAYVVGTSLEIRRCRGNGDWGLGTGDWWLGIWGTDDDAKIDGSPPKWYLIECAASVCLGIFNIVTTERTLAALKCHFVFSTRILWQTGKLFRQTAILDTRTPISLRIANFQDVASAHLGDGDAAVTLSEINGDKFVGQFAN